MGTVTGTSSPGLSALGSDGNQGIRRTFPELEPYNQIQYSVLSRTFIFLLGVLTIYSKYSQCIVGPVVGLILFYSVFFGLLCFHNSIRRFLNEKQFGCNAPDSRRSSRISFSVVKGKHLSYLPTPLLGQDMTQGQFLSGI